jgi:uncharacterized lipoprotein YddW (UPF0748 family)
MKSWRHLLLLLAVTTGFAPAAGALQTVDAFRYADAAAAGAAWRAIPPAPAVRPAANGLQFSCPFNGDTERVYWDRDVNLNLSGATSFALELTCDQPEAIRTLAVYFRSGAGWYIWSKPLRAAGRQRLVLHKQEFSVEGQPAGWQRIDRIRLSPWRGTPVNARLVAHSLTAQRDQVYVVSATLSAPDAAARGLAQRTTARVSSWLRSAGVQHAVITEEELIRQDTGGARVLLLPYNPQPPAGLLNLLRRFTAGGGKLIVCYSDSAELADLMDVKLGAYLQSKETGRWSVMLFDDPQAWRVPARVYQHSWNIRVAQPVGGRGEVIARWGNATGQSAGEPAWIATGNGAWMTHVLMDDDRANKERLLLGLVGHYDPSVWAEAARHALDHAGQIDNFPSFTAAVSGIRIQAGPDREAVEAALARATQAHHALIRQHATGAFPDAVASAEQVRAALTEAYSLTQRPRAGEFRGVWDHDGVGWYPGDWDRTCRELKSHGVNAIFPNVLWAGLAHYPSRVVPGSGTLKRLGDQMKACLVAARRHGLQVHAWKVLWQVENAPADFLARLRKEGRLQQGVDGKPVLWMNPALPANVNQELAAIEELARTYALDGIHLDYVRFPSGDACYSPASRRLFEAWSGKVLGPWPASVLSGRGRADYRRWRAGLITDFVRQAHRRVKAVNPDLKLSAAVWGGYPDTIDSIGQDWATWLREGYVDFVCPMNYTEDRFRFAALLQKQLALPGARNRIYPGIGVTASESQLRADEVVEQIATLRRLGAGGFLLFDLSQTLRTETLPVLGRGATRAP